MAKFIFLPFLRLAVSLISAAGIGIFGSALVNENTHQNDKTHTSEVNWVDVCQSKLMVVILLLIIVVLVYNYFGIKYDSKIAKEKEKELEEKDKKREERFINTLSELKNKVEATVERIETGDKKVYREFNVDEIKDNDDENIN